MSETPQIQTQPELQSARLPAPPRRSNFRLLWRVLLYHAVLAAFVVALALRFPDFVAELPIGGVTELAEGGNVTVTRVDEPPPMPVEDFEIVESVIGIAQTTAAFTQVFDAAGYEIIIIETVGAGQSEVDIARLAHTTLVVEAPGLGDDIQAIKAGILEIADVLVINKADRPGVENTERALRTTLELAHPTRRVSPAFAGGHHGQTMNVTLNAVKGLSPEMRDSSPSSAAQSDMKPIWIPPINKTIATDGTGIPELAESIARHAAHLRQNGDWALRDKARLGSELEAVLQEELVHRFFERVPKEKYEAIVEKVMQRNVNNYPFTL